MKPIPLINSMTRLWIIENAGYPLVRRLYVPYVVIHRVIFADGECRLLLRGHYYLRNQDVEYQLRDFKDGCYIEVHAGDCADPRVYDPTSTIMQFYDLKIRRMWFNMVGALNLAGKMVTFEWLEAYTKKWEIK